MRRLQRFHLVLLLAVLLIALDLAIRAVQRDTSSAVPLSSAFTSLEWQETLPPDRDGVFYVVFQPADCVNAVKSLQFWNELQASGVAAVRGVMLDAPSDPVEREGIIQRAGIKFPVARADTRSSSRVLRELGYRQTLIAVFVDHEGIIRSTMPTREQDLDKLHALKFVIESASDSTKAGF